VLAACLGLIQVTHAQPKTGINFWAVTGSVLDVRMYRRLAEGFERKSGIHVEVTPLAWGSFATKYFASMAAGLPPDIGVTNLGGPFDYGSVGGVVDLRAEFPTETAELEKRFPPHILTLFKIQNRLYGLPNDLSTMVMYYRTDVFAKLGLTPPRTWSETNALLDKLEAADYRYYFGFPAYAQWSLGLFTKPFGLVGFELLDGGKVKVNWTDPDYQKGVLEAMKLWHTHDVPGRDLGNRVIGMFRSSDKEIALPFMFDIHSTYDGLRTQAPEIKGKWDIAPWPQADDGKAFNVMGGTAYVIFRKSKHKREAMAWMQYLNSLESQRQIILDHMQRGDESGLGISPLREMWEPGNDDFWAKPEFRDEQKLIQVLRETYKTFDSNLSINGSQEAARLEANLLDQTGSWIRDRLQALADKRGTSISAMIHGWTQGQHAEEREELYREIRARLATEYGKIAPQAEAILEKETARYDSHYGKIVRDLPTYEKQLSVLDYIKWTTVFLIGLAMFTIGANSRLRKHVMSYLFVAPPLVLATIFVFVPAITALYLSFTEYHPVLPLSTASWVGLDNYSNAAHGGDLWSSTFRSFYYAAWTVPIGIILGLFFANLINSKPKGEKFWRFLYFAPLVTSVVSISLIFTQLFLGGKQGWLNSLFFWLGSIKDPILFLTSDKTFLQCVIVLAIWHGLAFTILIFVAGLQQIPQQLFEAAAVDGAGQARRFWNIALPGLRPQIFFVSVLGLIGAVQVFEPIYMLANKSGDAGARFGPNDSALTLVPLIYHSGFETYEMGKSAAIAYVMFLMILALTAVQFRSYRRRGVE
jgi:ABC-type sugar transport system permease subunit/ABC-type glycerol-3-phosphate transport system substrate-binding protein